MSYPCEGKLIF